MMSDYLTFIMTPGAIRRIVSIQPASKDTIRYTKWTPIELDIGIAELGISYYYLVDVNKFMVTKLWDMPEWAVLKSYIKKEKMKNYINKL